MSRSMISIIFVVISILSLSSSSPTTSNATPKTNLTVVLTTEPFPSPSPNVVVTMIKLTFPPGDEGALPHTHPGPVVGFVLTGEFLLRLNKGPHRILKAGDTFYEKEGDLHVWGANASNSTTCKVVATLFGKPGEPILTFVKDYERGSREEALKLAQQGK